MEAFILNKIVKFRGPKLDHFENLLKLWFQLDACFFKNGDSRKGIFGKVRMSRQV